MGFLKTFVENGGPAAAGGTVIDVKLWADEHVKCSVEAKKLQHG